MTKKILQLIDEINSKNINKLPIVFVYGSFNIIHPGHIRLLNFAKKISGFLIVGVLSKKIENRIILKDLERLKNIKSLNIVDFSFLINHSVLEYIKEIKPNYIVKGKEHETLSEEEIKTVSSYDGRVLFCSGDTFSNEELITSNYEHNKLNDKEVKNYISHHKINKKLILDKINEFSNLKVCIIGDTIIDEYINCSALGMSQEDPTIVVTPMQNNVFLGGAGIVAAHSKSLGANEVFYLSVVGNDENKTIVENKLKENNIKYELLVDESRPTTVKQRFRVGNKTLLRVSYLKQHKIPFEIENKFIEILHRNIKNYDVIIFSDFNYGVVTEKIFKYVKALKGKNNFIIGADCQSSSQIGDISKYKNFDLISCTEREARISIKNNDDGLVVISNKLNKITKAKFILIKLGSEGLLINNYENENEWLTDKLPAFNKNPLDVSGAGDSLLVGVLLSLKNKLSIWEASLIGSIVASCQVAKMGNTPITANEIRDFIVNKL